MGRDVLSLRQLMVLIVTALLMPATALLPTLTARLAGSAGWLSLIGGLPLLLGTVWATKSLCRNGIERGGTILRNSIIIMYLVWTALILMVSLRLSGARLAELYGETAAAICVAAMLLVAVWMGLGKVSAFARAAEIFYLALTVLLVGVLLLTTFKIEGVNFAMNVAEVAALPKSSAAAAGLLLNVYPAAALVSRVAPRKQSGRRAAGWIIVFCVVMALLVGAVIGCLGPRLAGTLPSPFLIMVQGLGVKGAFQRAEALIIALWTLSDLTLAGLLLHTWRAMTDQLYAGTWSRVSIIPLAVIAIPGAWILFPDAEAVWNFCSTVLPILGLILGFACPIAAWLITCARRKRKRA